MIRFNVKEGERVLEEDEKFNVTSWFVIWFGVRPTHNAYNLNRFQRWFYGRNINVAFRVPCTAEYRVITDPRDYWANKWSQSATFVSLRFRIDAAMQFRFTKLVNHFKVI